MISNSLCFAHSAVLALAYSLEAMIQYARKFGFSIKHVAVCENVTVGTQAQHETRPLTHPRERSTPRARPESWRRARRFDDLARLESRESRHRSGNKVTSSTEQEKINCPQFFDHERGRVKEVLPRGCSVTHTPAHTSSTRFPLAHQNRRIVCNGFI